MAQDSIMTHSTLTILIVAHNEEARIAACLDTARFADAIVVVLDNCSDGTRQIAQRYGATLVEGAWPNEGQRRTAGIAACDTEWILELDADEHIPSALAEEIRTVLRNAQPGYFGIAFNNYVGHHLVRHGWGAYNGVGAKNCLFAKGCKLWGEQLVHPKIVMGGIRHPRLEHRIDHYVYADLDAMFARLNRYSSLAAQQAVVDGNIAKNWDTFRRFFGRFYKSWIGRKGCCEGIYGVALALFSALYPVLTTLKARALLRTREARHVL